MPDTILVVEDEVFIRLAAADHLEDCGFTVLTAENAAKARALLEGDSQIDLVFTDVRMPGDMDGIGLAKWIMEHRPDIPVMVASGDAAKDKVMKELCAEHAFAKPYSFDDLTKRIRQAIAARRLA